MKEISSHQEVTYHIVSESVQRLLFLFLFLFSLKTKNPHAAAASAGRLLKQKL